MVDQRTVAVDEVFVEVPFRRGAEPEGLACPQIERVCFIARDHFFRRHGESDAIIQLAKLCDFIGRARLLCTEIIARHAKDD